MPTHNIKLVATEGMFRGLSKANMLFHHCVGELVDNAIAAKRQDSKFRIDVIFSATSDPQIVQVDVVDNGKGMSTEHLAKALQLGESATTQQGSCVALRTRHNFRA